MTRFAWAGVLLAGAASGCLTNQFAKPELKNVGAGPVEPRPVAPPVTANQITGENAQEKAKALRDELDGDMQQAMDATDAKK